MPCSSGKIRRVGYWRKAYTRKNGTRVKRTFVKSKCIKDRGAPGKGPKYIPKLKKGAMSAFGWDHITTKTASQRHAALRRSVRGTSYVTTIRRVNAVAVLNKRTNPAFASRARADVNWLKANQVALKRIEGRRSSGRRTSSKRSSRRRSKTPSSSAAKLKKDARRKGSDGKMYVVVTYKASSGKRSKKWRRS